jgi:hypothetical protein
LPPDVFNAARILTRGHTIDLRKTEMIGSEIVTSGHFYDTAQPYSFREGHAWPMLVCASASIEPINNNPAFKGEYINELAGR